MQLTKESIIAAGIEILDQYGLADMTMRRLASQLNVQPSALYWHFHKKQDLIEAIGRQILNPFLEATAVAHSDAVAHGIHTFRELLLAHRDGAELVSAALTKPQLWEEVLDQLAGLLKQSGFRQSRIGAITVLHFLLSATVMEQTVIQGGLSESDSLLFQQQFEAGIGLILRGLASKAEK